MWDTMDDLREKLLQRWEQFSREVMSLFRSEGYALGQANPPDEPGVYVLLDETTVVYVGIATNLNDRLRNKHISGDESHAIQRAYADRFPDRIERRGFIKQHVRAKWLVLNDPGRAADLERLLIWLYEPSWNRR
jgi:excinuclease UvrABC nuclease subunit